MSLMRRPVLQLNASYEALRIIPAMRALKLVTKGKATVELATNKLIYPGIHLPSVIRLLVYKHVPVRLQVTTRRNILVRDAYRCQYCGLKFHGSDVNARPCDSQIAGRKEFLGESCGMLPEGQPPQGRQDAGRGRHAAVAQAASSKRSHWQVHSAVDGSRSERVASVLVRRRRWRSALCPSRMNVGRYSSSGRAAVL